MGLDAGMRILCRNPRGSLWIEWATAGNIWIYAPLVSPAFPGNLTRIFFTCELYWNVWILAGRTLGATRYSFLFDFITSGIANDFSWQSSKPSTAWRRFFSIHLY